MPTKRKSRQPADGFLSSPSKRVKTLRPRKNAPHPFVQLPIELQLRILSNCDERTLSAFSITSTYFRELSLRLLWETKPIDTIVKNFNMLDEFEDLRRAVRHIRLDQRYLGSDIRRMSATTTRIIDRLKKNYFTGLTQFTANLFPLHMIHFVRLMDALSTYQPKNLKTLEIKVGQTWQRSYPSSGVPEMQDVPFPRGLTNVRLIVNYDSRQALQFDPTKVFDASKDTLVNAEIGVGNWYPHFSLMPCPNVKTLTIHQSDYYNVPKMADKIRIKFPNVETLIFRGSGIRGTWPMWYREKAAGRYKEWNMLSTVKRVGMVYIIDSPVVGARMNQRESMMKYMKSVVEDWIGSPMQMPLLERIVCSYAIWDGGRPRGEDYFHSFDLNVVGLPDSLRSVEEGRVSMFKGEEDILKAREVAAAVAKLVSGVPNVVNAGIGNSNAIAAEVH
ncbi:hypothetical protein ABW19_dt0200434 [Dactylella cylindrospora]|nr:hypothetical protein ABW19_dt0200434 [Dactylella cylindrospora]